MKTLTMIKKTVTTIVLSLLTIALFTTSAVAEEGTCVVRTTLDGVDNSLSRYIMDFNYDDNTSQAAWSQCTNMIKFELSGGANTVQVRNPLIIDNPSREADDGVLVIDGGGVALKSYMPANAAIFTVRGTHNVTIKNFTIKQHSGPGSVFVKCEGGSNNLIIDNITIDNDPHSAIRIDNCPNVQITNLKVFGSSDSLAGIGSAPAVIDVKNTDEFTFTSTDDKQGIRDILGTLLQIQDSTDVSIILKTSGVQGTVADLNGVELDLLNIDGAKVRSGLVLDRVTGLGDANTPISITLVGLRGENQDNLEGTGMILNFEAKTNHFENIEIRDFVGNGVEIYDDSNENRFHGVKIHHNTGSGIFVTEDATNNEIGDDSKIYNNGVCGIILNSTGGTKIYNTNLGGNGLGCPLGVSNASNALTGDVAHVLDDDDVVLVPTGLNTILVDINPSLDIFGAADKVELHKWTSFSSSGSVLPVDLAAPAISGSDSIQIGDETSQVALSPDLTASIEDTSQTFMVVIRDAQDFVKGVWYGVARQAPTSASGSAYGDDHCYTDPGNTSGKSRMLTTIDSDGDGLNDWVEDVNHDCFPDQNETNADLPDTDGDGLSDGAEVNTVGTDPILPDTDGDGLNDGLEEFSVPPNATQDLTGESNPKNTDTDGDDLDDAFEVNIGSNPNKPDSDKDGTKDGDDNCPTLHPDDGTCYYDYCDPDRASPAGLDADEDGLDDRFEDQFAPFCQYNQALGETDPQNPDTDGDGLQDGQEDRNNNGVVDQGETDPKIADTDSDCIVDGSEDNGDGVIKPGDKETNPLSRDSDEDGIEDGAEDRNCNGNTEPGETASYLADTDGDGLLDGPSLSGLGDIDVCPWSQVPGCVVYYHGVSGFDRDSDGDGLMDKFEDGDGNGLHNPEKKEASPLKSDTDVDGASDALEWCMSSNPVVQDSDGDGRLDGEEILGRKLTPEDFEPAGDVIIGPSISVGMNSLVRYQTQGGDGSTALPPTGPTAEPDTYFCTTLHQLNQTNPNKYDGANCSLDAKKDATSQAHLPITLIGIAMAILMVLRLRKEV